MSLEIDQDPTSPSSADWKSLGFSPELLALIEKASYREPTPIQAETIPHILEGKDLIASARTGSGKTAAFSLPLIEKLRGRRGTYGLILCPTREIALQTQETIVFFGHPLGVRSIPLIGGTDVRADKEAIGTHPQILVGTPGRICDHLDRGNLWLEFIEMLVLDEADRMLDMGFAKELSRITAQIPAARQTLLFSATMPPEIDSLARRILRAPVRVGVGQRLTASSNVEQELYWVSEKSKRRELIRFLEGTTGTVIVFTRTKDEASHLWRAIHAAGIHDSTYISSNKAQEYREEALQGFKEGKYRVMVATDVAGRGIHVENVSYVVNYDVPLEPEDYIHRIGRTGRKDARGNAITFATSREKRLVSAIERVLRKRIPERFARDFNPDERESGRHRPGRSSSRSSRRGSHATRRQGRSRRRR